MSSVEIKSLDLQFASIKVLQNLNLTIPKGEFLVLLGSSGGGKSTLLNCIAGLLEPTAGQHNEHPPKSIQAGQKFVADIISAVMKSPNWPRTALFFTYDEHGGFYDHVPPPAACPPDHQLPILASGDKPSAFDRYGLRVPLILISPWARKQYVSHQIQDHTSLLRFVQARFDLPALTARDANATPPMDVFDFSKAAFLAPPTLPDAVIDASFDSRCPDLATTHFEDEAATGK